jgi:ubiquinone biosynthesis protein
MIGRFTPRRLAHRAARDAVDLVQIGREFPYQVHDILEEIRDGQVEVGFVHKGLDEFMQRIDLVFNRLILAMIVAGGLLGSSILGAFVTAGPEIFGINFLAVIGFVFSGVLGVWLFLGVLRSGRI